jgi:hypothetical protein
MATGGQGGAHRRLRGGEAQRGHARGAGAHKCHECRRRDKNPKSGQGGGGGARGGGEG